MHVKNSGTGEWRFNVGAGFDNPPWVPDQVGGEWELQKRKRITEVESKTKACKEAGYDNGSGVIYGLGVDDLIHLLGMYLFRTLPGVVPLDVNNVDESVTETLATVADLETHVQVALGNYLAIVNTGTSLKKSIRAVVYLDQAALDAIVDPR